ncbi:glycosyltransferase [Shewanella gelidimarina]|uniref:glycosyltransferase n=1 Tax=Shewanella gelidimarina TaxID=56813 RepID=UPI00200BFD20|nr:glycosyltransferase [Shewanella gelidimarina]MCL1057888.1 glycosyltransferase [Shewanella gelidimarina]
MNTPPSIAVLLAAYNGEKYIREQLDSILNQRGVDLSIIISVDKCNDSTLSIVNGYASKYPSIIFILPYGKKYGSAGNNFTRLLCEVNLKPYQYISFADQDDIWLPNKLSRAVSEMKRNSADAYSSNVTAFWVTGKKKLLKKSYAQVDFDYLFESPGPGCTFLISRTLTELVQSHLRVKLEKGKTFWMHDWYCYSFARYNGFSWYIDPEPMMMYRQHELNVIGANSGWQGFIQRFKTIMNGGGFDKVLKQACFIGQEQSLPIRLISTNKRLGMLQLFFISWECRRQPFHKIMLSIACLIFFIKGYDSNEID